MHMQAVLLWQMSCLQTYPTLLLQVSIDDGVCILPALVFSGGWFSGTVTGFNNNWFSVATFWFSEQAWSFHQQSKCLVDEGYVQAQVS